MAKVKYMTMKQIFITLFLLMLGIGNSYAQEYRDLVADMTESHLASVNHDLWRKSVIDDIMKERATLSQEQAEKLAEQYLGERCNQVIIDIIAPRLEKVMSYEELESWNELWLQTEIIRVNQMINECLRSPELVQAEAADFSRMSSGKKVTPGKLACSQSLLTATSEYLEASGYFGWDDTKLKPSDSAQRYKNAASIRVANAFQKGGVTEELLEEMKTVTAYPEYEKMQKEVDSCLGKPNDIYVVMKKDLKEWLKKQ